MKRFPPQNEKMRLQALSDYEILDTEPESVYDDLTRLAATICGAPTALISLSDGDRQWFKSRVGLEFAEVPRDNAFCAYTILDPEKLFVVEDATKDARFRSNPLVTGKPGIRFYAGAPLVSPEGFALGSLCVIDYEPRTLSAEQLDNLELLARQVVSQLELRKSLKINVGLAERFNQVIMQASDGIHLYDFDGRINAANSKFCEMTGRTEAELLQMRVQDLLAPEELEKLPIRFAELRAGRHLMSERRIQRPDKSVVVLEISGKMLDANTIQGIARDITQRKQTEALLRQTEKRNRDLTDKSLGLICTHDFEGNLLSINPAGAAVLGYQPEELAGKRLTELLSPLARRIFGSYLKQIRIKGAASGFLNVITKSGEERIWKYNNVVYEESGSSPFVLGHAQDITELKTAENELRTLFAAMQDVILVLDKNGRYLKIAPTNPALLYRSPDEIIGKTLDEVFSAEQSRFFRDYISAALETRRTQMFEYALPIGEKEVWFAATVTPMTGDTVLMVARDITERKRMENQLRAAHDAALESARLKSAFLTNVSHEIRTPMNGVIGMTELLLDTPLDRTQRDYAETIQQSGDALLTIINDILDLSKIEAGKLRFETVDFDIRETIESTVEMFAERAGRKNIEIASLIEGDVPQIVRGDPGRLRQVLTNFVGNAVKFTESGEIGVSVAVEKNAARNLYLRFTIADSGIGIASENIGKLFQPFVQIDNSTTRRFAGTGLGLIISKQIIEMMNGEVTVESEPQKGSRFSFTACFDKNPAASGASEKLFDLPPPLDGKKILIADSKQVIRQTLCQYVSIWGMNAAVAGSGEDALRHLEKAANDGNPFDVIVIDTNLPDWEGFALAQRIKSGAATRRTQIILTTAHGQRGDAAQAQNIGISGYLTKPVRGGQFFDCLTVILAGDGRANEVGDGSPAALVTRHSLRAAKTRAGTSHIFGDDQSLRLLVVEDNEVNSRLVARQLEQMGLTADFAFDGRDALEKLALKNYQIVLMDCQMPRLDGYDTTREIRRLERKRIAAGENPTPIVVIALTAHTLAGEREKCLSAGMNDYLPKPVRIKELASTLEFWGKTESAALKSKKPGKKLSKPKKVSRKFKSLPAGLSEEAAEAGFSDEIQNLFLIETERQIGELQQSLKDGDFLKIARLAHAVRGNSLSMGAQNLAEIMKCVEETAKINDSNQTSRLLNAFLEEFSRLQNQKNKSITLIRG